MWGLIYAPFTHEKRSVHFQQYNRHCPYTSMHTSHWDGCYAIHPVEAASQRTNRCHMNLYFSFTAVQLTFISLPISSFLSCSVGVVCPCARCGNIINMSVILYCLTQSFLKSSTNFPKYSSSLYFTVLAWTVGYTTPDDTAPTIFRRYCYISSMSVIFQVTDRNTDKMNTGYRQKAPTVSLSISHIEHKWALN